MKDPQACYNCPRTPIPLQEESDVDLPRIADEARPGALLISTGHDPDPPEAKLSAISEAVLVQACKPAVEHAATISEDCMREVTSWIHKIEDCQVIRPQQTVWDPFRGEMRLTNFGHDPTHGVIFTKGSSGGVSILTEKKNTSALSAVSEPEWIEIEVTVDSGACDTVMPTKMCTHISILDNDKRKRGFEYEVANGAGLPNHGERRCFMMTENSELMKKIAFQCADVHKPLLSVSALADQGYECVLGKLGGELRDVVTGDRIPLHRRDNLYVMRAWIRQDDSSFRRQE